jgi:hypothetical protein
VWSVDNGFETGLRERQPKLEMYKYLQVKKTGLYAVPTSHTTVCDQGGLAHQSPVWATRAGSPRIAGSPADRRRVRTFDAFAARFCTITIGTVQPPTHDGPRGTLTSSDAAYAHVPSRPPKPTSPVPFDNAAAKLAADRQLVGVNPWVVGKRRLRFMCHQHHHVIGP